MVLCRADGHGGGECRHLDVLRLGLPLPEHQHGDDDDQGEERHAEDHDGDDESVRVGRQTIRGRSFRDDCTRLLRVSRGRR